MPPETEVVVVPPIDPVKVRRQARILLAVINALVLATGLVASVDLRRLESPGGTALRWVQAAVFGDCGDYLHYSVAEAGTSDPRSHAELCHDLRTATAPARADALKIALRLDAVRSTGGQARAAVTITRSGTPTAVTVHLVRRAGHWRVLRDAETCNSAGCA